MILTMKNNAKDENTLTTTHGYYRYRYHLRALFQGVSFAFVVGGFCLYNKFVKDGGGTITGVRLWDPIYGDNPYSEARNILHDRNMGKRRFLSETSHTGGNIQQADEFFITEEDINNFNGKNFLRQQETALKHQSQPLDLDEQYHRKDQQAVFNFSTIEPSGDATVGDNECTSRTADPAWMLTFYFIGVLYMFLALAIVCDEFFVPALEEMSSVRRLNLSMDVAGATLMAAGGSAPELFTSLFGTFRESEVGFGTIVGSAVFNVLFVIAMCALLAKEVLDLTWWPLFRDSLFYAIGLIVLAVFVGVSSKEKIELYEAIILFLMYIVYVFLMWKNADLYKYLTGKELEYPDEDEDGGDEEPYSQGGENGANGDPEGPKKKRQGSISSANSGAGAAAKDNNYFRWQGTFRAGILKLLRNPNSWVETAGNGIVARIYGDAEYVFKQIDGNGDGEIDKGELKHLFELLECDVTPAELDDVFDSLDINKDGTICEEEFNKWYIQSEERIRAQVKHVFDSIDVNKSNTIDRNELKLLLETLDSTITDKDVDDAIAQMYKHGARDEITFEEFSEWYQHSILFQKQKKEIEEEIVGVWENVIPPWDGGFLDWLKYLLVVPLVLILTLTIPDVRRPGMSKWCYIAFFLSIIWIGLFAYLMVDWAQVIGATIGIPDVVMGLTILAAGTSVPDMLSSVIVARRGCGDMAVSSSIGSNIFDILVGLPVPWFLYIVWPTKPNHIDIAAGSLWLSILILLGMLVFVIACVHCQGWRLTKTLAVLMLAFYFAFLGQAVYRELPFSKCT